MMAVGGFAASPAFAGHHAEAGEKTEAAATDSVPAYVVAVSGGGWGATKAAREAISSQEGVKTILLSGLRATVFMEEGKTLDEAKVKAAIESKKLKFESFGETNLVKPTAAYVIAIEGTGVGWAISTDKARAALEEMDGVTAAFVNKEISLCLAEDKLDEKAVASTIESFKMKFVSAQKADELPF